MTPADRARAECAAQGVPEFVEDEQTVDRLVRILRAGLEAREREAA